MHTCLSLQVLQDLNSFHDLTELVDGNHVKDLFFVTFGYCFHQQLVVLSDVDFAVSMSAMLDDVKLVSVHHNRFFLEILNRVLERNQTFVMAVGLHLCARELVQGVDTRLSHVPLG